MWQEQVNMVELTAVVLCFLGLQLKHFLADFCFQTPYMLRNKGIYGHPGGLMHAALHGLFTVPALNLTAPATTATLLMIALVEVVVHYHVDWLKERIGARSGYGPDDQGYWIILGSDQLAHQLTLIVMVLVAFS